MPVASPSYEKSAAYNTQAAKVIPGSVNSNVRLSGATIPLCFERAEGAYLYDVDGNCILDYALGMGPSILGHAPKPVCDAVAQSLSSGQMFAGQHPAELTLARRLQALIPSAERVRIGMTGSEVVQAAIRLARAVTGRRKYIKFEGQYHGWFDNVLISHAPPVTDGAGHSPRNPHAETKGQLVPADDIIILPWNDITALRDTIRDHRDTIAAVITEPAMCNTGALSPLPGYLEEMRALTTEAGIVLIFDEVITGFRLGIGGGQARFGVTPDLSTFAKAMAGGFPVSALVGKAEFMDQFGDGSVNHSGTYNSNVPSIVAAIATLDMLEADNGAAYQQLEKTGQALIAGMNARAAKHGVPLHAQGFGAVFNTHFSGRTDDATTYEDYKKSDPALQKAFLEGLAKHSIRPTGRGTWFVSTAHGQAEVDKTLAAVDAVLSEMAHA